MLLATVAPPDALPTDDIALPDVAAELRRQFGIAVTYQQLWAGVVSGRLPAYRLGRRYRIKRGDLPNVAAILGATAAA